MPVYLGNFILAHFKPSRDAGALQWLCALLTLSGKPCTARIGGTAWRAGGIRTPDLRADSLDIGRCPDAGAVIGPPKAASPSMGSHSLSRRGSPPRVLSAAVPTRPAAPRRAGLPAVYDLEVVAVNVGFRPATRDHLPLIGATEVPGLHVATGHFRHGVLLAPGTAVLLADLMGEGRLNPILVPFRRERLSGTSAPRHDQEQGR